MIRPFLQPDSIITTGEDNKTIHSIYTGVLLGSLLILALFNLYTDTITHELAKTAVRIA